ncbi:putative PfkB domain-containing protein [Candidatus Sulfotelmatomonas gaucii]|uniref:Putative PfkB domain-containing protein n=1 Tax=Candidatus Sulfuritelmatomonas gaucii TaxID=2043161 RepID=A0A2N9L3M5_9BACT|nr:putative PfkB domain-containing protein [Candidatus Sulfotelmatomonas gaucii]
MKKRYDVLGVGIAAVDDLKYVAEYPPVDCKIPVSASTRQGGGPACTAIAAAGVLGGRAAYVARFGNNELSHYMRSALASRGVDTSHIVDDAAGGPYHSIIVVDSAGHRNVFYDPALYRTVTEDDLPGALIQSAQICLLDHITEPSLLTVAEKVRRLSVPIVSDIEGRTSSAQQLVQLTDYLILPKAFAAWASGEINARDACVSLARTPRLATIVTDGAAGCYACSAADPAVRHFSAFQVQAFDTTGCGDTFHGAFALAVARQLSTEDAILFASAAAALKAMAAGGQRRGWDALPTLTEVIGFLQSRLEEPQESSLLPRIHSALAPG